MVNPDMDNKGDRLQAAAATRTLAHGAGFTLVEILAALSIAGILLTIATTSFTSVTATQRVKSAATDLYIALTKARNEALKLNSNVTLQTDSQWSNGWYIADPDPTITTKLLEHGALKGLSINGSGSNVTFRPSGRVSGSTAPTFTITASGSDSQICVNVDLSGRPYQKTVTPGASC
jgi:prepilin-type N-terminal cleavage/methylation domain-containing protein